METVSDEIKNFEKDVMQEEIAEKLIDSQVIQKIQVQQIDRLEKGREVADKKLAESRESLKSQKQEIRLKDQALQVANKELDAIHEKKKDISSRISKSAKKPRGCPVVRQAIEELAKKSLNCSIQELFDKIKTHTGGVLFIEDNMCSHSGCLCEAFGIDAFYRRFQNARKKNST